MMYNYPWQMGIMWQPGVAPFAQPVWNAWQSYWQQYQWGNVPQVLARRPAGQPTVQPKGGTAGKTPKKNREKLRPEQFTAKGLGQEKF